MAPKKSTQNIYQLKITLRQIKPPIWRRVLVESNTTLGQLHSIVQEAMGWDDYHLHSWNVNGMEYGVPDEDYDSDMRNEKNVKLSKLILDFGQNSTFANKKRRSFFIPVMKLTE